MRKKKNKNIRLEIAVGIVLGVAVVVGVLLVLLNESQQVSLDNGQQTVTVLQSKPGANVSNDIVFLGDSITALENWNALLGVSNITNAGISGNTTDNVLARLDQAISSHPRKLFLMIGINDFLQGKDVDYVANNYAKILDGIKTETPDTLVYIQSVLPTNNDLSKIGTVDSQKILDLNSKLKAMAAARKLPFINLYPSFCGPDHKMYQRYAGDGVHPSSVGYDVWKRIISRYMEEPM